MRAIFGVLSLVVVLLVVMVLAKKQLTATQTMVPVLALPPFAGPDGTPVKPGATVIDVGINRTDEGLVLVEDVDLGLGDRVQHGAAPDDEGNRDGGRPAVRRCR